MFYAFLTGFFLGLSLIVAIGAQNAFVLRQGIHRHNIFYIALFCSISDSLLIILGVIGISHFFKDLIHDYSTIIFGLASLWLFSYGLSRLHSAFKANSAIIAETSKSSSLFNTLPIIAVLTFGNPHVYLDTVILIGSISQQFIEIDRFYFSVGACSASFVWFFGLGYGAKLLSPLMQKPAHWRILDLMIALIMLSISLNLLFQTGWL